MRIISSYLHRFGVHHPTFAVCICQFGSTLLHTVFMFYYVKIFLNVYHVNERWFDVAQVLFLFWNALNDPIFGYLQNLNNNWMKNRRKVILYVSPFFAASFLLPWFPWGDYVDQTPHWIVGLHLITSLYVYDGLFSFVLLAWCSLFAEITTDHASRVRAVKYMQIAILLGVNILVVMDKVSKSLSDLRSFQICSVFVAFVAFFCFYYTGRYSQDHVAQVQRFSNPDLVDPASKMTDDDSLKLLLHEDDYIEVHNLNNATTNNHERSSTTIVVQEESTTLKRVWRLSTEIMGNWDFQRFVWMNFLFVCRSTLHMNFAAIFTERLIPETILPLGSWRISLFYGFGAVFPQIVVILGSSLVNKYGSHKLLMTSFSVSVISSIVMFMIGLDYPICIMLFMLVDSVVVHSFTPLTNILCADLIDADMVAYKRSTPVSSVIFGLNALICKPGISLAPMLVVYLLDSCGYEELKNAATTDVSVVADVRRMMFDILCIGPVILAGLQWVVFRNYSLHSTHISLS